MRDDLIDRRDGTFVADLAQKQLDFADPAPAAPDSPAWKFPPFSIADRASDAADIDVVMTLVVPSPNNKDVSWMQSRSTRKQAGPASQ
jgi:hypothetical protein